MTARDGFVDALDRRAARLARAVGRPWCWLRRRHHPGVFHPVCATCGRIVPTGRDEPPRPRRPRRFHAPPPPPQRRDDPC